MNDFCIIIQGPSNYVGTIKDSFTQCNIPLIFSTWNNELDKYNESDIVVLNEKPEHNGVGNINLQMKTTLGGLNKAKELGFKRALKFRSDMIPTNPLKFIEFFKDNMLTFFCWHYAPQGSVSGYMVDYFMAGEIDDLIKIWTIDNYNHWIAEVIMTNNIIHHLSDSKPKFIINDLTNENDIYWLKYNQKLSEYKTINSGSYFGAIDLNNEQIIGEYKNIFN